MAAMLAAVLATGYVMGPVLVVVARVLGRDRDLDLLAGLAIGVAPLVPRLVIHRRERAGAPASARLYRTFIGLLLVAAGAVAGGSARERAEAPYVRAGVFAGLVVTLANEFRRVPR